MHIQSVTYDLSNTKTPLEFKYSVYRKGKKLKRTSKLLSDTSKAGHLLLPGFILFYDL